MSILNVRDGAWLDAQVFPPLKYAVPGLIPQGFGLFTGPPKIGKSWFVFGVGLAVAAGESALGALPTGPARPVLYLALEDGDARLQSRARALLGPGVPIPQGMHTVVRATPGDVLPGIVEWLDQHRGTDPLVILDTLGRVMPQALPGESAYQRDYRIGAHLKGLVDEHPGATLAVVHHTRKQAGEDWMDSTSGTNGLNGAADWTLSIGRARGDEAGTIRVTGRDIAEGEFAATIRDGRWTLDGADLAAACERAQQRAVSAGVGDVSAAILSLLAEHPDGLGPTNVAAGVGIAPKHAGTYLSRLVAAGRAEKVGRGQYRAVRVESVESVELPGQDALDVSTEAPGCGNDTNSRFHTSTLSTRTVEIVRPACAECGDPLPDDRIAYGSPICAACVHHRAEQVTA